MQTIDIKYLADAYAERKFGINAYAVLLAQTGSFCTFKIILAPNYTVGYVTYDNYMGEFLEQQKD